MALLLELHDLRLRLGGHELLRGVELAVNEGEVHVLLGANGAGKSSLAYAVMGCEGYASPDRNIRLAGERLNDLPLQKRARRVYPLPRLLRPTGSSSILGVTLGLNETKVHTALARTAG